MKTEKDKMAYAVGYDIGKRVFGDLKKIEISKELFLNGLADGVNSKTSALSDTDAMEVLNKLQQMFNEINQKEIAKEGESNLMQEKIFFEANSKKEGVVTLPSGLQYKVITQGAGKIPKATDTVVTHYRGTVIDGTEFDNSYTRGEPASFPVNKVIKGWTEALQLMNVGSKWELYIPSALAYGNQQRSEVIKPNSVLIFTIELLDVK